MDENIKTKFLHDWKKFFDGAQLPIAFFYSDELHNAEPVKKVDSHHCIIADIARAFRGKSIAFNADNTGCKGGKRYCGFSGINIPNFNYFLSFGIPGIVRGERYKKDPKTVKEFIDHDIKMEAPAKWLIVKPFDQLDAVDEPEVIIFFATADVLAGLFTLANYDRSDLYGVKSPFCAGCGSIFKYPMLENLSERPDCIFGMFDPSARPNVPAGVMSFAIPMRRFEQLAGYMDESFLITDTWETMRKRISKNDSVSV